MDNLKIERFNPTVAELQNLVELTKDISATDLEDKKQIEVVKKNRIALRDARITISKKGKELREEANAFSKAVIAKEKELISIITPEEDRLKNIEDEAKKIKIQKERLAILPQRIEKLNSIGDNRETNQEELLEMDDPAFTEYYNQRVADKNEADKLKIEQEREKQAKEAERLENEKKAQEREKQAREDERKRLEAEQKAEAERKEREAKEAKEREIKGRVNRLEELGFEFNDKTSEYKHPLGFIIHDSVVKGENFEVAITQIIKDIQEQEERIRLEKEKRFNEWLDENKFEQGKDLLKDEGDTVKLYKLTSIYKK